MTTFLAFLAGAMLVAVPASGQMLRVYRHANATLDEALRKWAEMRQLFHNAQVLRSDEERVAELAFMAWGLEKRFDAAVREIARLEREAQRARSASRGCSGRSPASARQRSCSCC